MVIFGAGVVTGGLLVRRTDAILLPRVQPGAGGARTNPASWSAGGVRLDFLRRAQRELELTPEQRERIDLILKESQERTRRIMEPVSPQIRDELQRARAEFRAVLTLDQQVRFDELARQSQRPREARRPGAPEPRPPEENRPRNLPPR